jgi:hypothetical protein
MYPSLEFFVKKFGNPNLPVVMAPRFRASPRHGGARRFQLFSYGHGSAAGDPVGETIVASARIGWRRFS